MESKTGDGAQDYPPTLDTKLICKILDINIKTCYKMFHDGTFPEVKSGRAYRVSRENFIDYLNKRRKDKSHD